MKQLRQTLIATSLLFLTLQPVVALANEVSLAEYQDFMVRYSILMDAGDVTAKLKALTQEEWQQLYDLTPSKGELAEAIIDLEALAQDAAARAGTTTEGLIMPQAIDPNVTVMGEFEPRYPDVDKNSIACITSPSTCYGAYIFPSTLLFLPDSDEPGIQDDRCKEHQEAIARESHIHFHGLAILAQVACDISFLGCAASGVASGLDFAAEEFLVACEVHTGNVDGAEIEAAYENSRTVLDKANSMTTILNTETNFTDDAELAAHETAITSTMSSQHRALNAELTLIKNQLTQQQAQLEEVIRLLNTPQGKRSDWNK